MKRLVESIGLLIFTALFIPIVHAADPEARDFLAEEEVHDAALELKDLGNQIAKEEKKLRDEANRDIIVSPQQSDDDFIDITPVKEVREDEAKAALAIDNSESDKIHKKNLELEAKVSALTVQIGSNEKRGRKLEGDLRSSHDKNTTLQKQLDETKQRLMIAEAEVARLSHVLEVRSQERVKSYTKDTTLHAKEATLVRPILESGDQTKVPADMVIATVIVDKANLRTGPSKDNSPLMSVAKGTRLAVETRNGDWYRVIAPSGARAWVSSDVLVFGSGNLSEPTRTIKIKGYDSSLEDKAYEAISSSSIN